MLYCDLDFGVEAIFFWMIFLRFPSLLAAGFISWQQEGSFFRNVRPQIISQMNLEIMNLSSRLFPCDMCPVSPSPPPHCLWTQGLLQKDPNKRLSSIEVNQALMRIGFSPSKNYFFTIRIALQCVSLPCRRTASSCTNLFLSRIIRRQCLYFH